MAGIRASFSKYIWHLPEALKTLIFVDFSAKNLTKAYKVC
jgi:hypothetical protein